MPGLIAAILQSRATEIVARVLLTFPFWGSGLDKLLNFPGALGEMRMFGLEPAAFYAVLTIVTELGGSLAVITGRFAWLGAGALGVFTALTIPIAHAFWAATGADAVTHFHFSVEHLGMIGGLVTTAILAARPRPVLAPASGGGRKAALAG